MVKKKFFERVLLIREPWLSMILSGEKLWEMRTRLTHVRGVIGLSCPGSNLIVGTVELVDCLGPLTEHELVKNQDKHRVPRDSQFAKYNVAWVTQSPKRLEKPLPFIQKPGAVIWLKV